MGSEFMRIKGILDKIPATEDETRIISEVLRIKTILVKSGDESVVHESLTKLQRMAVSMKILEATEIGKSVSDLRKNTSKDNIKKISRMLIKAWRLTVDEWIIATDKMQSLHQQKEGKKLPAKKQVHRANEVEKEGGELNKIPTTKQQLETTKRKLQETKVQPEKRLKRQLMVLPEKKTFSHEIKKGELTAVRPNTLEKRSFEKKLEATKRKLQQGYNEAQSMKKMRRTQVLEVHEVLSLGGLAHKHQDTNRFGKRRSSCLV